MKWEASAVARLRGFLSEIYSTKEDSIRVVTDAGLSTAHIAFKDAAINNWFSILEYAKNQEKLSAILAVALSEFPNHDGLQAIHEMCRSGNQPAVRVAIEGSAAVRNAASPDQIAIMETALEAQRRIAKRLRQLEIYLRPNERAGHLVVSPESPDYAVLTTEVTPVDTACRDSLDAAGSPFAAKIGITQFDDVSVKENAERAESNIAVMEQAIDFARRGTMRRPVGFRAVVVTALALEYTAVRNRLTGIREDVHRGTVYEVGRFQGNVTWDVMIVEAGAGNQSAAFEAERAIVYFGPHVAAFVGVAGGIKDVQLGDVVVASKVYGYESGKASGELMPRPDVGESSHALVQRARAEARTGAWTGRLAAGRKSPRAFVGAIAAGEKVVSSNASHVARFVRQNYGDALAIEMEGRGFLRAAHANEVQSFVVRGISDLLDGKTEADSTGSQELAADHASAFLFEVLARYEPSRP